MTVAQNIAQLIPPVAEASMKSQANMQSGSRQTGLFNSIFENLTETDNQTLSGSIFENQESGQDTKTGGDVNENVNGCLAALIPAGKEVPENSASIKGDVLTGKSLMGMMNKTVNRIGSAILDMTAEGKASFSVSLLDDVRRTAGEMEQVMNQMILQEKPVSSKSDNPEKTGPSEKSLKRILEKLDELISLMNTAGNPLSSGGESDRVKLDLSRNPATESGEKETMRQIVSSMRQVIDQCNGSVSQEQTNRDFKPDSGVTTPFDKKNVDPSEVNRLSEQKADESISVGKASDHPDKRQLFASLDKTNSAEDELVTAQNGDGKLFSIKAVNTFKPGERPMSLSVPAGGKDSKEVTNQGNTSSAAKNPDLPNVETVFRGSSAAGDFSKGNGDGLRNPAENGKGIPNPADLSIGIRSFEMPPQSREQSQNPLSEPTKPVSHEQIMTQVRENLAAHQPNGDTSQIIMKLHPEDLGELKISMKMENQRLKIDIVTENQTVKEALMQNTDSLKETLSRQNIAMDRFNVLTGGGHGYGETSREWRQTARNSLPGPLRQLYGFSDEPVEKSAGYLDSSDNSLIDLRL